MDDNQHELHEIDRIMGMATAAVGVLSVVGGTGYALWVVSSLGDFLLGVGKILAAIVVLFFLLLAAHIRVG